MISLLSFAWLSRRELHAGKGKLPARRLPRKPWLEALENRDLLSGWTTVAPMPTAVAYLAGARGSDGRIYAFDGSDDAGNVYSTVQAYSANTDTWSVVAMMNTARDGVAAAAGPDGRIYVFGGSILGSSPIFDTVESYSPSTRTASIVAPMNTPRDAPAGVTGSDGRIYALGGSPDGTEAGIVNTAEAYNTRTNVWVPVASMSTPRHGAAAALGLDGRIYVFGGKDNNGNILNSVECYSPSSKQWTTVASMSTPRWFPAAARGPGGRLYVMGGFDGTNFLDTVESYNPSTNVWSAGPSMANARAGLAAATGFDGRIYAFGGVTVDGVVDAVEALGGFGPAAPGAKPSLDAFAEPVFSTVIVMAPTVPPLREAGNTWAVPGNAVSDTPLRHRADVLFAAGAGPLSDVLAEILIPEGWKNPG